MAEKSGCEYVVDSSKDYVRFMLLREFRPNDVKLIVLKRDIKGVASSSHHGLNENLIRKRAFEWNKYYNKTIPSLLKIIPKSQFLQIQYENLCQDYNLIRQEISSFIAGNRNIDSISFLSPYKYHTVQGNPMRLSKKDIEIKFDERWRNRLTDEQIKWLNSF